MYLTSIIC